jgi:hypothetical protein
VTMPLERKPLVFNAMRDGLLKTTNIVRKTKESLWRGLGARGPGGEGAGERAGGALTLNLDVRDI